MNRTHLIIADSERNANLYYATRFLAPDPFIFAQFNGKRVLVMSDLELDRARFQAKVEEVVSFSALAEKAKQRGKKKPSIIDVVDELLKSRGADKICVPADFGLAYADSLRALGYTVAPKEEPFYSERLIKSDEEIAFIARALKSAERALAFAIKLIGGSEVKSDKTLRVGGGVLTAEKLRKIIHLRLMEEDCLAQHTIVSPGAQAVDPHNEGFGPLRANEPIVIDLFPRHSESRYFADITRTVVKGKASSKVRRMFEAVKEGQDIAFGMIKDGVDGSGVHKAILDSFEKKSFHTGEKDKRMQGFFHGTGHGIGLEIHEPPRIGPRECVLKAGMVVTVEPGLYYPDAGGIRLEDMVVITKDGCRRLNKAPKILEV